MRILSILLLLLTALQPKAQNIDSTGIKLEHYKEWRVQGLISEKEYQRLKGRLLHIPFDINADADSTRARVLKDRYHGRTRGGTIMICIGGTIAFTSGILAGQGYSGEDYRKGRSPLLITGVTGGVAFIVGAVFLGLGLHSKMLFCNQYLSLEISGHNNALGLACNF